VPIHSIRLAGPWYFSQSAECPPRPPDVARHDRHELPFSLPVEKSARLQRFFQRPIRLDPREAVRVRIVATRPVLRASLDEHPLNLTRQPDGLLAPLPLPLTGRHCLTLDFAPADAGTGPPSSGELQEVWLDFLGTDLADS